MYQEETKVHCGPAGEKNGSPYVRIMYYTEEGACFDLNVDLPIFTSLYCPLSLLDSEIPYSTLLLWYFPALPTHFQLMVNYNLKLFSTMLISPSISCQMKI